MNWDDPMVYPGKKNAAHLHSFFGNTLTDAYSTETSLRTTGNSTCRGGTINRSAYWVPSVIDADGHPQKPYVMHVYYKTGYSGIDPKKVKPFPQGLRILAGNPKAITKQDHTYWECVPGDFKHPEYIPACNQDTSVVLSIDFPQCWDGVNLDSPNHKSHMSYPVNGSCPNTHPVAIPAITFKVHWKAPAGGTKGWRLSSDMYDASLPGGLSAHGDWFEAWDPEIVKAFVENCDNPAVDCHSHLLGDGREIQDPTE